MIQKKLPIYEWPIQWPTKWCIYCHKIHFIVKATVNIQINHSMSNFPFCTHMWWWVPWSVPCKEIENTIEPYLIKTIIFNIPHPLLSKNVSKVTLNTFIAIFQVQGHQDSPKSTDSHHVQFHPRLQKSLQSPSILSQRSWMFLTYSYRQYFVSKATFNI